MFSNKVKLTFFIVSIFLFINLIYSQEIIDRIIASIGDEAITLSDLKIAIHFNLFPKIKKEEVKKLIERMVNQKIIKKKIKIELSLDEEIEKEKERLIKMFGTKENFNNELMKFDLTWEDLKVYIEEKIYFDKVIQDRFKFISPITLDEIKKYYDEVYVPEQKKKKLYPKSLLEVAGEIESIIENQKREKLILEWLKGLKKNENIEFKVKE